MMAQELLFVNRLFKLPDLLGIEGSWRMEIRRAGDRDERRRALAWLASWGLKPSRYIKRKPRQDAAFGLGALKRRPYNDAHNCEAKASEPATVRSRYTETRPTLTVVPSCCGTVYPTSGRSPAVTPDVSACFSITYNGKLL